MEAKVNLGQSHFEGCSDSSDLPPYSESGRAISKEFYAKFIGFASQLTWGGCLLFYPGFLSGPNASEQLGAQCGIVFLALSTVLLLLISKFSDFFVCPERTFLFVGAVVVLDFVGLFVPEAMARVVCYSFAYACLVVVCCGQYMSMTTHFTLFVTTSFAIALAGLVCTALSFLDLRVAQYVIALLPFVSIAMFFLTRRQYYSRHWVFISKQETIERSAHIVRPALVCITTGCMLGIGYGTAVHLLGSSSLLLIGPAVFGAGLIMFCNIFCGEKIDESIQLKLFAPVSVLSLSLICAGGEAGCFIGSILLIVYFQLGNITSLNAVAELARFSALSPLYSYLQSRWHCYFGVAVGFVFVYINEFLLPGRYYLGAFLMLILVVVSLCCIVFESHYPEAPETEIVVLPNNAMTTMGWKKCIEDVGRQYGLSPRQVEVMGYLAKGRNAQYIQDAFFISKGTVKTHIASIYRKLDVHSQQELISLVEREYRRDSNNGSDSHLN